MPNQDLLAEFKSTASGLTVMAFDLLWQDGEDLTALP